MWIQCRSSGWRSSRASDRVRNIAGGSVPQEKRRVVDEMDETPGPRPDREVGQRAGELARGPGTSPPTAPSAEALKRTVAPDGGRDRGGRFVGPEFAEASAHRTGVVSLGGLVRWFVSDGKAQEPGVVAQEAHGRHPQVFGHQLERTSQEVVGQAHRIAHGEHRESMERPSLVDQVCVAARLETLAPHFAKGHHRIARRPPGDHVDSR